MLVGASKRVRSLRSVRIQIAVIALSLLLFDAARSDCLVIAHRGASGYLPEHTLPAFELAIEMGADYIEPDIVLTRDGVPVVRHESQLDLTTDVASRPEFAERRREVKRFGEPVQGWFTYDFTLAELRRLRARERYAELRPRGAARDGEFSVPTLQDVIDLVAQHKAATGVEIGIYPELKNPQLFTARGLDIVSIVTSLLEGNGYSKATDPAMIQSFDAEALVGADKLTNLRLVQLMWADEDSEITPMITPASLRKLAAHVDGIGVPKYGFVQSREDPPQPTRLVADAHAAGLFVHVYTFRAENNFLPAAYRSSDDLKSPGDLAGELSAFLSTGIDGFFIDHPDVGRQVCDQRRSPL